MLFRFFSLLALCVIFFACGEEAAPKAPLPPVEVPVPPVVEGADASDDLGANDQLFPWVDGVNVRAQPDTGAKRVARVLENEPLLYLGESSSSQATVLLRGVAYREPWHKVKTKDGTEGWIFGGTVRRENEKKGNPVISETNLMFPYFGRYDLTEWDARGDQTTEEGDATTRTRVYYNNGQTMTITETNVGEYGYRNEYVITDVEDRIILERELAFDATDSMTLTETVTNHLQNPIETYVRSQQLDVHPIQLGGNPQMVNGVWRKVKW